MITNAKLISLQVPGTPDRHGGGLTYAAPVALECRCAAIEPKRQDKVAGATRTTAEGITLYVLRSAVPQLAAIPERSRVTLRIDQTPADRLMEVQAVKTPTKAGGLSHFELALVEVPS